MGRSLDEIRTDRQGTETTRNLVDVLHTKLDLATRYGMYEYQALEEGQHACADAFCTLAREERAQVGRLIDLLYRSAASGRFRARTPDAAERDADSPEAQQ